MASWAAADGVDVFIAKGADVNGVLVDIGVRVRFLGFPVNRMTAHLFDDLKPFVEDETPLFGGDFAGALASILRTKCEFAQGDPGNTGQIGDIYWPPPNLWLVRNEVGGWTAMYHEDY